MCDFRLGKELLYYLDIVLSECAETDIIIILSYYFIIVCMYVCMYNLYFRLRNTEQHSHTVLGSIDN